jgi:MoaA/NifB/PqqE/SkfB family radical SAM enzyme
MDDRRWTSIRRCREAYTGASTVVSGYPQEIYLEVAARCNLRCVMCPLTYDPTHQPGGGVPALFPPELFARLRPLFPTLVRAYLYGLGEPMLNRHLGDYARELSAAGVEVWITTNATLIDAERAESLVGAGVHRISVSADGATAATYEAIRRRGRFADLLRGLEALGGAARRHGRPHLTVNFVAMASNLAELPAMARLCGEIGVAELNVEPLFDWTAFSAELGTLYRREHLGNLPAGRVAALLAEAERAAAEAGVALRRPAPAGDDKEGGRRQDPAAEERGRSDATSRSEPPGRRAVRIGSAAPPPGNGTVHPCSEPWSTVSVTAAGEVATCCLNGTSFGNLYRQSFDEIWNGPAYQTFRRRHLERAAAPGCGPCLANGRQRLSPWFLAVARGTVRPLLDGPAPARPPAAPWLDRPCDGETVTDPLVVSGRLSRWDPRRLPILGDRWLPRLQLDAEGLPGLAGAVIDGVRFVATVRVPYLSEGAHVLALARGGVRGPGWSRRTVHFRRPPDDDGGAVTATSRAAVGRLVPRCVRRAEVRIGGRRWTAAEWLCGLRGDGGWVGIALADLRALAPGRYELEVEPEGLPPASYPLVRLTG